MSLQSTDPVTNPLYYLDYLEFVLEFVRARYSDVLNFNEQQILDHFFACSLNARALYARLLTRKPVYFRVDKLAYSEIDHLSSAIDELVQFQFLELAVPSRRDLNVLMRSKAELKSCGALGALDLIQANRQDIDEALLVSNYELPNLSIVRQRKRGVMSICQHLFFGNPHQHLD